TPALLVASLFSATSDLFLLNISTAMKNSKPKEAGDSFWEQDAKCPRVTSASLMVPKEITKDLFNPDGSILDRRLETIQYRCYCRFRMTKLSPKNPGHKVCDRVVVDYSYPTKNHHVTLRLFSELVQQRATALRVTSLLKVSGVTHMIPQPLPPPSQQQQVRAKSALVMTRGHHALRIDSGDSTDMGRSATDE
ncbi:hypothetical protein BOX15_Mlig024701g1, partial [Macrostomum lignano]